MPGTQSELTSSPLIPFVLPQTLSSGMRMGMGRLFGVTAAANTATVITHNLGRIPHFVVALSNGANYTPQTAVTVATISAVTVQFNAAMSGWVWVV